MSGYGNYFRQPKRLGDGAEVCAECGEAIDPGEMCRTYRGKTYHEECLRDIAVADHRDRARRPRMRRNTP